MAGTLGRAHEAMIAQSQNEDVTDIEIGTHWVYASVGTVHCIDIRAMAYPLE